jgi:glycosyltransferase involved in cell wall biosynthesis
VHGLRARQDVVIHNGIDTARFSDTWSPEDKRRLRAEQGFAETDLVVGLCGVMRPEKAHGDFLRALAQVVQEGQGAETARTAEPGQRVCGWLIGDGPLRAALERDIDALGLRERVRISGFAQDVRPLVAACDAMAITSTTETFSLAALEAMALGKPLLMTDVGGAREQVRHGHSGWLVPVGDVNAMAGALARWQDPAAREAMGRRAAAEVRERFELAGMVRGFERQFNALV